MKLSLEERRRRRKAEQQRQLMEDSQRAEEELRASRQQSQQQEEEEEEEMIPPKKKKRLLERSNLFNNNNNNESSLPSEQNRFGWNRQNSALPGKKSYVAAALMVTNGAVAAALDAPKKGTMGHSYSSSRQRLLQSSPSTPGLGLVHVSSCHAASPQSSVSMSQPSPTMTKPWTSAVAAAAAAASSSSPPPPPSVHQTTIPRATGTQSSSRHRRYYYDSDSSNDDPPNNLAKYRKMQADAAAAAAAAAKKAKEKDTRTIIATGSASSRHPDNINKNSRNDDDDDSGGIKKDSKRKGVVEEEQKASSKNDGSSQENQEATSTDPQAQATGAATSLKKKPPPSPNNNNNKSKKILLSKTPRNPLARMKEEARRHQEQLTLRVTLPPRQAFFDNAHYARQLDQDDDDDNGDDKSQENQEETSTDPPQAAAAASLEKKTPSPNNNSPSSSSSTRRNPLARMKEEARHQEQLSTRATLPRKAFDNADYARQLDQDDDHDDNDDNNLPVEKDDLSTSSSEESKKKKKKKRKSSKSMGEANWTTTTVAIDSLEGIEGREKDQLCLELKPVFRDNQVLFKPLALEPIQLDAETEDGRRHEYEVPASMARYMYGFQHDGIRFMFHAIMTHRAAILGDDMGLGKTIQTIGLLAALLRKKGTGADLIELHRRARLTEGIKSKVEEAKQDALRIGQLYRPVSQSPSTSSAQPEWAPVLILAPSSVLENWIKSFKVWGHFSVAQFSAKDKAAVIENVQLGSVEIVVASHACIAAPNHVCSLREIPWKLIIIDEFHIMKNEDTKKAANLRLLRDAHPETILVGLTGTCMQNNHEELWNLFDIVSNGYLGKRRVFMRDIARPIMVGRTKDATPHAVERGLTRSEELSTRLYQILLERKKEDVLKDKLPEKDERIVFCELSPLQKKIYNHVLAQPDFLLLKHYYAPCDCGVNQKFFYDLQQLSSREERIEYHRRHKDNICPRNKCCYRVPETFRGSGEIDPRAVIWRRQHENDEGCRECPRCICLPAMGILTKLSSHVGLLQPSAHPDSCPPNSSDWKEATKWLEIAKTFIPKEVINKNELPSYILEDSIMDNHFSLSGKMAVLARLLKAIDKKGGRVLLFSASTKALDLIQNYVVTSGYSFLRMDGGTPTHKRQDLADEFNNSPGILLFLLSTKAMGLGLNLTSANYVIIFDVDWNPSWDSQAQDRSYRIGQKRDVTVFRLVSQGTLEEQKYLRQVYKTQLKKETMVDVDDPERDKSARLFRGIAKDLDNRGELFGMGNLLRFQDGTMRNYGAEAKESTHFGRGIYSMESIEEAAKTLPDEEDDDDLSCYNVGVADIAKRSEKKEQEEKGGHDESDSEDSMIGAESQFAVDIEMHGNDAGAFDTNIVGIGNTLGRSLVADSVPSLSTHGGTTGINSVAVADSVPSLAMHNAGATTGAGEGGVTPMAREA